MNVDAFLDHVHARGATVVRSAKGAVVTCLSHEDRRPSFAVTEGRDGRVLLHCRAGCSADDVLGAFGLRFGDLFPNPLPPASASPRSTLERARQAALARAGRQAWARPGVLEMYEAADAIRAADRLRCTASDTEAGWELLSSLAAVTTAAENSWNEATSA